MPVDEGFEAYLLEQLGPLGDIRARRMFGGTGLYRGDVFFAILWNDRLFCRTDDATRERYLAAGIRSGRTSDRPCIATTRFPPR